MPLRQQPLLGPVLWLDARIEDAAAFYLSVFPDSEILQAAPAIAGVSARTVSIDLAGLPLTLHEGAAPMPVAPSLALSVRCATQSEVDHYWTRLGEGGTPGRCGWIRDRYGIRWQVMPERLAELLTHPDRSRTERVVNALLDMGRIDITQLEEAHEYA